jgi:hypothetical protein
MQKLHEASNYLSKVGHLIIDRTLIMNRHCILDQKVVESGSQGLWQTIEVDEGVIEEH